MDDQHIEKFLTDLEEELSDELDALLAYDDLSQLSTDYLYELFEKWKERVQIHQRLFRQLLLIAATSPLWFVIGIVASLTTTNFWLPKIMLLFPISIFFFLFSLFLLHKKYGSIHRQEYIGELLLTELRRRQRTGFQSSENPLY